VKLLAITVRVFKYLVLLIVLTVVLGLVWLRWESHQPRDDWFVERHGELAGIASESSVTRHGQPSQQVTLQSDSGLTVRIRSVRDGEAGGRLPVLMVLGGHRTGRDSVDLFGEVDDLAVVGIEYPYDGPEKVRGARQILATLPLARRAILDTVPAASLVVDWLVRQPWVDTERIVIVGASLGVPFASEAAARDLRIDGAMLVHGAADTRLWLEAQVERRIDVPPVHYPLLVLLYWLSYAPVIDTSTSVAAITPRPVVIVGARNDERTPAGQTELLYSLAGDPKRLRFTDGAHIEPDRTEIIQALLAIAGEEIAFLSSRGLVGSQ
jgi:dienelactone hydrolase